MDNVTLVVQNIKHTIKVVKGGQNGQVDKR